MSTLVSHGGRRRRKNAAWRRTCCYPLSREASKMQDAGCRPQEELLNGGEDEPDACGACSVTVHTPELTSCKFSSRKLQFPASHDRQAGLTHHHDSANGSKGGAYRSKHRKQHWQREPDQSDRDDNESDDSSDLDVLGVVLGELVGLGGDADEETDDGCMSERSM